MVPAIVYYELRRELLRAGKTHGLARLDAFCFATRDRYLPLEDSALRLAADLWADARRRRTPTADPKALDVDVILAAQVLNAVRDPSEAIVLTTNPAHLSRFVTARRWTEVPASIQ